MISKFPNYLRIGTLGKSLEERIKLATEYSKRGTSPHDSEIALIDILTKVLNFNYTFVFPKEMNFGQPLEDGNWTGVIGLVHRGECDLSFLMTGIFEERSRVVDFSYPYYISSTTFMTQSPQPLPKNLAMIYPFSNLLWITFLMFTLAFSVLFSSMNVGKQQWVRTMVSTLGNVLGQPFSIKLTSRKLKFLFIAWVVGISFLIHSYKALLLSFLVLSPTKGISTIAELSSAVADGSIRCRGFKGSYLISSFTKSNDTSIRVIGNSMRENSLEFEPPEQFLSSPEKRAFIATEFDLRRFEFQHFLSKDSFFPMMFGIPVRRNFCCMKALDEALKRIVESGLYEKFSKDIETRYIIRNVIDLIPVENEHALTTDDIIGAVAVLICGLILAFVVFLLELLLKCKHN